MIVKCKVCHSQSNKLFDVKDINQKTTEETFHYYRCESCKLTFLENVPANLSQYYGDNYSAYSTVDEVYQNPSQYDLGKIEILKTYVTGKKILEVGPGNGVFAYLSISSGYDLDVIEMDKKCCEFLETTLNISNVYNSENILETLRRITTKYDAIVLWHVIEHICDTELVINELAKKLNDNGTLIIAAPNPDALQFKIFKRYWKHLDAPRHINLIPIRLLRKLANNSGLHVEHFFTNDPVNSIFNSYGWWVESIKNIENKNSILLQGFLKYPRISKLFFRFAIEWLQKINGLGNGYTVILKKHFK